MIASMAFARSYHRWCSVSLQRDMELLVFGHAGRPGRGVSNVAGTVHRENRGLIGRSGRFDKVHASLRDL